MRTGNPILQWEGILKAIIIAIGMAVSTTLYVYGNDAKASERIAILETKYDAVQQELSQLRSDVKDMSKDIKAILAQTKGN